MGLLVEDGPLALWRIEEGHVLDKLREMPDKQRLAYLAGILDGEGYIGIKKSKNPGRVTPGYHARCSVKMNNPAIPVLALKDEFGGRCAAESGRSMMCWQVTDAAAETAMRVLLPWLLVKRRQALNLLEFRAIQATSKYHRTKIIGTRDFVNQYGCVRAVDTKILSDEYVDRCGKFWDNAKRLNSERW